MTAGTSPFWRSLRARPVPWPERGVALNETVAIRLSSFRTRTERRSETDPSAHTLGWLLPPYHTAEPGTAPTGHERSEGPVVYNRLINQKDCSLTARRGCTSLPWQSAHPPTTPPT